MKATILFLLLHWCKCLSQKPLRQRRVHLLYPVELLAPVIGSKFKGNVTKDRLSCFGNRDYSPPTYIDAISCMFQSFIKFDFNCDKVWGTRSVQIETFGNIEILKVNRLPEESSFNEYIAINATRWMDIAHSIPNRHQKVNKVIPVEPIYLCVRSIDWMGSGISQFKIQFGNIHLRESDLSIFRYQFLYHFFYITIITSSLYLLPYVISILMGIHVFNQGMKLYVTIFILSVLIVCLAPFMLTQKNRHLAYHYVQYFFTRGQAEETTIILKEKTPVFQAIFFSSLLLVTGSLLTSIIYSYTTMMQLETKNYILRLLLSISGGWFIFFVCRSFERFFKNWIWVGMSVILTRRIDTTINPLVKNEMVVALIFITYIYKIGIQYILLYTKKGKMTMKLASIYQNLPPLNLISISDWILNLNKKGFLLSKRKSIRLVNMNVHGSYDVLDNTHTTHLHTHTHPHTTTTTTTTSNYNDDDDVMGLNDKDKFSSSFSSRQLHLDKTATSYHSPSYDSTTSQSHFWPIQPISSKSFDIHHYSTTTSNDIHMNSGSGGSGGDPTSRGSLKGLHTGSSQEYPNSINEINLIGINNNISLPEEMEDLEDEDEDTEDEEDEEHQEVYLEDILTDVFSVTGDDPPTTIHSTVSVHSGASTPTARSQEISRANSWKSIDYNIATSPDYLINEEEYPNSSLPPTTGSSSNMNSNSTKLNYDIGNATIHPTLTSARRPSSTYDRNRKNSRYSKYDGHEFLENIQNSMYTTMIHSAEIRRGSLLDTLMSNLHTITGDTTSATTSISPTETTITTTSNRDDISADSAHSITTTIDKTLATSTATGKAIAKNIEHVGNSHTIESDDRLISTHIHIPTPTLIPLTNPVITTTTTNTPVTTAATTTGSTTSHDLTTQNVSIPNVDDMMMTSTSLSKPVQYQINKIIPDIETHDTKTGGIHNKEIHKSHIPYMKAHIDIPNSITDELPHQTTQDILVYPQHIHMNDDIIIIPYMMNTRAVTQYEHGKSTHMDFTNMTFNSTYDNNNSSNSRSSSSGNRTISTNSGSDDFRKDMTVTYTLATISFTTLFDTLSFINNTFATIEVQLISMTTSIFSSTFFEYICTYDLSSPNVHIIQLQLLVSWKIHVVCNSNTYHQLNNSMQNIWNKVHILERIEYIYWHENDFFGKSYFDSSHTASVPYTNTTDKIPIYKVNHMREYVYVESILSSTMFTTKQLINGGHSQKLIPKKVHTCRSVSDILKFHHIYNNIFQSSQSSYTNLSQHFIERIQSIFSPLSHPSNLHISDIWKDILQEWLYYIQIDISRHHLPLSSQDKICKVISESNTSDIKSTHTTINSSIDDELDKERLKIIAVVPLVSDSFLLSFIHYLMTYFTTSTTAVTADSTGVHVHNTYTLYKPHMGPISLLTSSSSSTSSTGIDRLFPSICTTTHSHDSSSPHITREDILAMYISMLTDSTPTAVSAVSTTNTNVTTATTTTTTHASPNIEVQNKLLLSILDLDYHEMKTRVSTILGAIYIQCYLQSLHDMNIHMPS